jgi:C4-dicarboxylate transporter DctQ subunit
MQRIGFALRGAANGVAASMLAALFLMFILQVADRYILHLGYGWTQEVQATLWLWLVLWGAAFCLTDTDHVKFDLLYQMASPGKQRFFKMISALAIIIALAIALPAAWDYVDFYKIKRSATLQIRMKWVFIIYIAFSAGLILRYSYGLYAILRSPAETEDPK